MKSVLKEQQSHISPDGTILFNSKGKILHFDDATQRITGLTSKDWRGKSVMDLFNPGKIAQEYLDIIFKTGEALFNLSVKIRCSSLRNESENLLVIGAFIPVGKPGKLPKKCMFVFRNTKGMVSLMQSYDILNKEWILGRQEQDIWFENSVTPFFRTDADGQIMKMNPAFLTFADADENIIQGYRLDTFFNNLVNSGFTFIDLIHDQNWEEHKSMNIRVVPKNFPDKEGDIIIWPARNKNEEIIGYIGKLDFVIQSREENKNDEINFVSSKNSTVIQLEEKLRDYAENSSALLLLGEGGTGLSHYSRMIHDCSLRGREKFYELTCCSMENMDAETEIFGQETKDMEFIPGVLDKAAKGTLVIHNFHFMPVNVQEKLISAINSGVFFRKNGTIEVMVTCRFIFTANMNSSEELANNDLVARTLIDLFENNVFNLLPLRERKSDLAAFCMHFIKKLERQYKKGIKAVSPQVLEAFYALTWPDNIRQLEDVVENAYLVCDQDVIDMVHLPSSIDIEEELESQGRDLFAEQLLSDEDPLKNAEKIALQYILNKFEGHRRKTAEALGLDKSTLWRKMKKYDLID